MNFATLLVRNSGRATPSLRCTPKAHHTNQPGRSPLIFRAELFRQAEPALMERRKFTREFKLEAVKLIKDRGVSYAQASHDLGVHQTVLRNWVKAFADDPVQAFPGHGQMKPEQAEIARLKRELTKLRAERDILKKAAAYFAKEST